MKNRIISLMLALSLIPGIAALAEAPAATEEPAEETLQEETEGSRFLEWIGQGLDLAADTARSGWHAVSGWADATGDTLTDWYRKAEEYLTGKDWSEEAREAWNTLKEEAEHKGSIARDELEKAYRTLRDWCIRTGETVDQGMADIIDAAAGAAGVAEATVSGWYRTVEDYVTSRADTVSDSVREAWETIKEANATGLDMAREGVRDACETVKSWLDSLDEDTSVQEEAIDGIMEQLETEGSAS